MLTYRGVKLRNSPLVVCIALRKGDAPIVDHDDLPVIRSYRVDGGNGFNSVGPDHLPISATRHDVTCDVFANEMAAGNRNNVAIAIVTGADFHFVRQRNVQLKHRLSADSRCSGRMSSKDIVLTVLGQNVNG